MNWNEIKQKYPKAEEDFAKWYFQNFDKQVEWVLNKSVAVFDRTLFDFFDEQVIYISIGAFMVFGIRIYDKGATIFADSDYKTRTEAEEKAFEKAFEILENKLEGKK